MRLNDDGKTVAAADCLVPGIGEIIGGSQREERLELLERRMDELGMNRDDYWWYLDLRRYGGTKHAGYGLGLSLIHISFAGVPAQAVEAGAAGNTAADTVLFLSAPPAGIVSCSNPTALAPLGRR